MLTFGNMEHADHVMLEVAGICSRDRFTVCGVVDTRNSQKPLSTKVRITDRTYEVKIYTRIFILVYFGYFTSTYLVFLYKEAI
jgi:hypothetical protein